jgi:DNA-binding NtrC family response regulator
MTRDRSMGSTVSKAGARAVRRRVVPARLTVVHPLHLERSIPLGNDPVELGRAATGATVQLEHGTVSRQHFIIEWDGKLGAHVGRDAGSRNGSSVNGADAKNPRPLRDNDVVRLGDVLLVYECGPALAEPDSDEISRDALPGISAAMRALRSQLHRTAGDPAPALVVGETGTGKEWVARELHRLGKRRGELVSINCAALSPQLVESQLFGHQKGAFTGATEAQPGLFRAADGGTLFLDEIGELPPDLQPKLLRAIQDGEVQPVGGTRVVRVDVRVIAATHRDLAAASERGQFRRDLYARLSLWELRVPPLRARRIDLFHWIARLQRRWREGTPLVFEPDAAAALLAHPWPLNLRQIDRLVHELGAEKRTSAVAEAELPAWLDDAVVDETPSERSAIPTRDQFVAAFEEHKGSVRALAKHFGRDRRQIYRWLDQHGLRDRAKDR